MRLAVLLLLASQLFPAFAAKRILMVTHSAGFRHESIPVAVQALQCIGLRTGAFEVTPTEDLSLINADELQNFDAVFFFTSGELELSDQQKQDLLNFVKSGKGFGGAHSATDTLYTWEEYGKLIGGTFDGHPWAQEVNILIEDPDFPGMKAYDKNFRIVDEIYQFRNFSRENVRVLFRLDTSTVDLTLPNVNRTDGDFALAWCRSYGNGRVFYTALGHFDDTWRDRSFQQMLEGALLWLIGDVEADASPRPAPQQ